MAEIKIEKKKTNWLPWLVGLLILLLVGWFALEAIEDDADVEAVVVPTQDVTVVQPNESTKETYSSNTYSNDSDNTARNTESQSNSEFDKHYAMFVKKIESNGLEMNLEHEYCNAALRALANSLTALTVNYNLESEANIKKHNDNIEMYAKEITEDWRDTDHADMVRKAALSSVDVFQVIQNNRFPSLDDEVNALRSAAMKIDPGTLTLEQKKTVKSFFDQAADLLNKMRSI